MGFAARQHSLKDLHHLLHYDSDTGHFFWRVQAGNVVKPGDRAGSLSTISGYRVVGVGGRLYREHRLAWLFVHGKMPNGVIDHVNGVKDDNRISNLRLASHAENMQNKVKPHKGNKVGFMGVGLDRGKYRARINIGGKQIFIGHFTTAEEASAAYLERKRALHIRCSR